MLPRPTHGWLISLVLLAFPAALCGQTQAPPETAVAASEVATGLNLDVPQPPRVVLNEVPIGGLPPVPVVDAGLPQPYSAPVVVGDLERQPLSGQFTFFRNRDQRPAGVTSLNPGEPSAAASRDTYFATGNTYGALSKDSGMTWTHVNPFTLFPAVDGGVCCDQRVLSHPGSGLVLWYIQYRFSATTNTGGFRLAWARSRDQLRASNWSSVYFSATAFGFPGNFLDFPDIAVSNEFVYLATNVFTGGGAYQNSLVIRIATSNLVAGGNISAAFYRRSGGSGPMGGGASYRFTQTYNGAPSTTMFWASHNSTSSLRIFAWGDTATARAGDVDRTIPTWTSGAGSAPGPDGRDWIGFDDHRIATGYINPLFSEGAFLWTSNSNGGSRPQSYVRVQVFNPGDRSIRATEDVFSLTLDFAYPAVSINRIGHAGMVVSGGSSTTNVTTFAMLVDNYFGTFAGNTIFSIAGGSNGAPSNRWGDYHSVVANSVEPKTFIGTGQVMSGGTAAANIVHRTVWFGRDDYTLAPAALNVRSAPFSGVPITVDETDRNGAKNGTTPFARSFTPEQGYTLRAPASFVFGNVTYSFRNWTGSGGTSTSTVYTVSSIGAGPHTATANYGVGGSFTALGTGCPGSNSLRPTVSGLGTPAIGQTVTYRVSNTLPTAPAFMHIGLSSTNWLGIPLPFDLNLFGASSCFAYCDQVLTQGTAASAGVASLPFAIPFDLAFVGVPHYVQWTLVDSAANRLGLTTSNYLRTTPGTF